VEGTGAHRQIAFRTNVDDLVQVDAEHPLRFEKDAHGGIKPYVKVRGELWALVTRTLAHDLIALAEERDVEGRAMFGIGVNDAFFPIAPVSELSET
jgi:hypothetical protein